eukprot:scpid90532/ scgid2571/ 
MLVKPLAIGMYDPCTAELLHDCSARKEASSSSLSSETLCVNDVKFTMLSCLQLLLELSVLGTARVFMPASTEDDPHVDDMPPSFNGATSEKKCCGCCCCC